MNTRTFLLCIGMVTLSGAMTPVALGEDDSVGRADLEALKADVEKLRGDVNGLVDHSRNTTAQIEQLSSNLTSMSDEINQQLTKQMEIIKSLSDNTARIDALQQSIAATDTEGQAFLRLDSIMDKSVAGREQVQSAVNRSLKKEGTLTINNKMGADQDLLVNGAQHRILAGGTLTLNVGVGTITTRLPGQEIVNWAISPPGYSQSIDILPKHETWRPVSSAPLTTTFMAPIVETPVVETPVYVSPPVYVDPLPVLPFFFYP